MAYNYPKSSATAYQCKDKTFSTNISNLPPTNLAIGAYDKFPPVFDCYNNVFLGKQKIPQQHKGPEYESINPNVIQSKYAQDFRGVNCNISGCNKTTYISSEPRLLNAATAQNLLLDKPPITTEVKLANIAEDKNLDNYGQNYSSYADINAGQIMYYIDKPLAPAYHKPVFDISADVYRSVYQDPMGALDSTYDRVPDNQTDPINQHVDKYEGCLSFIQDSAEHRQDIISKQMSTQNREKWSSRWA